MSRFRRLLVNLATAWIPHRNSRRRLRQKLQNLLCAQENLLHANQVISDKFQKLEQNCEQMINARNSRRKIYFLNDTTRNIGHLGCRLACDNIIESLRQIGCSVLWRDNDEPADKYNTDLFRIIMKECDAMVINGEGTLHHDKGGTIFEKSALARELGKKVFLINTSWEKNDASRRHLELFDFISVRDSQTKKNIENDGYKGEVFVAPDMVFLNAGKIFRKSSVPCLAITDSVDRRTTKRLFSNAHKFDSDFYCMSESHYSMLRSRQRVYLLDKSMAQPLSLLVSGRFHATCFAIAAGIPVLSIKSNTAKTEGMLHDANVSLDKYFLPSIRELTQFRLQQFIDASHNCFIDASRQYVWNAGGRIHRLFDKLQQRL